VHSLSYSPTTSSATHQGLGSHASSPASLVFAPLQAPPVLSNIVPRAHHCWTYGPLGRNQDKSLCHLLLSIDHRGIDLGVIYWLVSGPLSAPTSPVARLTTIRVLISLAASYGLTVHQMDVKTTFLLTVKTRPDRDRDVYALFLSFMSIIISCIKTTVTGN
jgi:hypothetical protein